MEKCHLCDNTTSLDECDECNRKFCPDHEYDCEAQVDDGGGYSVDCWGDVCTSCEDKHQENHY